MKRYKAKAHANIALIKYWGKEDEELIIPNNNSLSMTLENLYTETIVNFSDSDKDLFYLDNNLQDEKETAKFSKYIDIFRKLASSDKRVEIHSFNHVPTAAGLASSASGFAALSAALNSLFELNYDKENLTKLARLGSGSASRSIYGGFVEWIKGEDHETSFAKKIDDGDFDIAMIILVLNEEKKDISSRKAMKQTVETSPLYKSFVESSKRDIFAIKKAIKDRDIDEIGKIAEHNAMKMHATMLGSNPPIIYFKEKSIQAINKVKELRKMGFSVYYTMDAGPNVKLIVRKTEVDKIIKELKEFDNIIISNIGNDVIVEELV
nr:diphosphomevalonate decarboxylase [Helcococcus sueciensis]